MKVKMRNFVYSDYFPFFILALCYFLFHLLVPTPLLMIFISRLTLNLTFGHRKSSILVLYIIAMGFISRMAIAFFPIVYASGTRTHTFLSFSILICCLLVFQELVEERSEILSTSELIFSGLLVMLTNINLIMST